MNCSRSSAGFVMSQIGVAEMVVLDPAGDSEAAFVVYWLDYCLDAQDVNVAYEYQCFASAVVGGQAEGTINGLAGHKRQWAEAVESSAAQIPCDRIHGILPTVAKETDGPAQRGALAFPPFGTVRQHWTVNFSPAIVPWIRLHWLGGHKEYYRRQALSLPSRALSLPSEHGDTPRYVPEYQ